MTEAMSILTDFEKKSLFFFFFKELRWLNIYIYTCVTVCVRDLVCTCSCVCVRKLSTTPDERVPAVCQLNGQKLGHSE